MGLNVGSVYSANYSKSMIDTQALAKVTEQILNPNSDKTIDVAKLNLSKFNRPTIGMDLYSAKTGNEKALIAAKAATDFDVNLSKAFSANVQYLNSMAAQSLFTSKENNGRIVIPVDNINKVSENEIVLPSVQVNETKEMNKDKRGSNPFAFYMPSEGKEKEEESESAAGSINIFA